MKNAIEVRKIPFEFCKGVTPVWNPSQHEWSHMVNGASLTMPHLEPFLNRTLREAKEFIDDPQLLEDIKGFMAQEAQHYANHRRMNDMLKARGYPELATVEESFVNDYDALGRRTLARRLAYCAGFETMTMGITEWLVNDRNNLFGDSDPTVASFVLWHMVEETEHKNVAFDVFQALSGSYWLRILGLLQGSLHVGFMSRRAYRAMLKKDGLWSNLGSRLRLWKMVGLFFIKSGGAMVNSLKPSYHPSKRQDPAWVDQWRDAYEGNAQDFVPLLDTSSDNIAPTFA
ncbi:MAG: metal-dependent hydrolase [Pseudomonadota bacterium]